jgi:uncharacterized protein
MVKPRGALCNLDCTYCFYLAKEGLYSGGTFRMSDELLETYIRQNYESQRTPQVTFAWQGGEPTLMGLDFFRRAVELQQAYRPAGVSILNTIQTNGILLDDEWAAFFHEHGFLVGVSLDGPQSLHDAYRVDKGGAPTHARVLQAIRTLERHAAKYNLLCCVHAANQDHPLEVYRFFRDEVGARFVQFIPVVEQAASEHSESGHSVGSREYGRFLSNVFDEWVRRDVGRVFVQIFDVALAAWAGYPPGLCIFDETCGLGLALEHNGDLYSCDHFVEPGYYLGNIQRTHLGELAGSPRQATFGQAKREALPAYCRTCEVRFICNGGCPKDRFLLTPPGEPGLNYLCEGYRAFFNHIDGPMKIMASLLRSGRAPAEVMAIQAGETGASLASSTKSPGRRRRRSPRR